MFTLVLVFCLFASSGVASAQNDWDSVLDRYESITAQCKALRDKVASGEPVSQKSVTSLFGELGRLRNMLQQSSGKMTKAQRDRFERIRRSYDGSVPVGEPRPVGALQRPVGEPVEPPATTDGPVLLLARVKLEPLPAVYGRKILRFAQNDSGTIMWDDSRVIQSVAKGETKVLSIKRINILPTLSLGDTRQGGLFLAMTRGQWGGYFSLRTNLKSQLYAYDILSDGTTGGEARFEAKGGQRLGEYSASAGVVRTVTPWMDLYAGAGYGSSILCWNDIHGAWAKVRDYSAAGLLLDGGVSFHVGQFSLLGGVSYLPARPEAGPCRPVFTVGAGFAF